MKSKYEKLFSLIHEGGHEIKHTSLFEDKLNIVVKVSDVGEKKKIENLVNKISDPNKGDIDLQVVY